MYKALRNRFWFVIALVVAWILILCGAFPSLLVVALVCRGEALGRYRAALMSQTHVWWGARICALTHWLLAVRIRWVVPTAPIPPSIVIANHVCVLDILEILALAERLKVSELHWVGKAEAERMFVIGTIGRWLGTVFVTRNKNPEDFTRLRAVGEVLTTHGASIVLFPTGTRGGTAPKHGGFQTLLEVAPKHRIVSVGIVWDPVLVDVRRAVDSHRAYGHTVTLVARVVGVEEPTHDRAWLVGESERMQVLAEQAVV